MQMKFAIHDTTQFERSSIFRHNLASQRRTQAIFRRWENKKNERGRYSTLDYREIKKPNQTQQREIKMTKRGKLSKSYKNENVL